MNNSTIDLLLNRRSIRAFADTVVNEETLQLLKTTTLRAPTAGNQCFYSIIEVKDTAVKHELAVLCDNQIMIEKAPIVWIFLADSLKWDNFYKEAGSVEKGIQRGIQPRKLGLGDMHLSMQDAIIAAGYAQVAAEALGLGSCYIGDVIENHEKMVKLLNLKPQAMVACMLIMGYPKEGALNGRQTKRCPNDSVFMTDSYKEMHLSDLQYAYKAQEQQFQKIEGCDNIADRYYFRKHMSPFMEEMNRSAKKMIKEWEDGKFED